MLIIMIVFAASIAFVVAINLLIYKWIVYDAKRKFIMPFLVEKGWSLSDVRHTGFFNTGDFEAEFSFASTNVNVVKDTYVYVTASNSDGKTIKFTAKIVTVFFFIRKVEYKGAGII